MDNHTPKKNAPKGIADDIRISQVVVQSKKCRNGTKIATEKKPSRPLKIYCFG